MAPGSTDLLRLPPEILSAILVGLPNRDLKSVRLACRALCAWAQLRWDRVFLSANPRNIEVFRAIADHEVIRNQISEIFWDDARLIELGPRRSDDPGSPNYDPSFTLGYDYGDQNVEDFSNHNNYDDDYTDNDTVPPWFVRACQKNITIIRGQTCVGLTRLDPAVLAELEASNTLERSWEYYQRLLQQQSQVLSAGSDSKAFEYGLQRFPALRRITITPAAHGWLLRPLYETPMIRDFPPSFNYPIPTTWPVERMGQRPWQDTPESEKVAWRGFRLVMLALASAATEAAETSEQPKHQQAHGLVKEIVVDVNQLFTGLNAHIFDEECPEQRHLAAVLGLTPGFRRLDLALGVRGLEHYGWRAFRSGCLRRMLAAAPRLEHVSLATDLDDEPPMQMDADQHFVPLRDIFPIASWANLRHFGLLRFMVRQADLFALLAALPPTLRSLELSFLIFQEGSYRDLVADMRDRLGWRERRPAEQRPCVTMILENSKTCYATRGIWADGPVEQFLYHDGPNPFGAGRWGVNQIGYGLGAVVKDTLDPAFERPWVDYTELMRLGYRYFS